MAVLNPSVPGTMRAVDAHRDLAQVADLVEASFKLDQDAEGRQIMRQMRKTAERQRQQAILAGHSQFPGAPQGVVWELDGKVVGNVSILPFQNGRQRIALIANVAVAEEHRGQGIASGLTRLALRQIQRERNVAVWLQVRSDNNNAVRMYRDLGFKAHSTIVQWQLRAPGLPGFYAAPIGWQLVQRRWADWAAQKAALDKAYPKDVRWYQSINFDDLSPWSFLDPFRWVRFDTQKHLVAYKPGQERVFLSLVKGDAQRDHLLLADRQDQGEALGLLVAAAVERLEPGRLLSLEYPAGRSEAALANLGFKAARRLDWMRFDLGKAL